MKKQVTISTPVLRMLIQSAGAAGASTASLLAGAGVDPALLDDADARVPEDAMARLWEGLARELGENVGLYLAERRITGTLDIIEYLVCNSPDLGTAFTKLTRYQQLLHDDEGFTLEVHSDTARLVQRAAFSAHSARSARYASEHALATLVLHGRSLTGVDWAPRAVAFRHPAPSDTTEHQRIFRTKVAFDQDLTEIVLDAAVLALPVKGADPALYAILSRHADDRLSRLPAPTTFLDQVRRHICEGMEGGVPAARDIARALHMSQRSFERHLHNESTTYRELVDAVRRELATSYIREGRLRLTEVSFLLGFAETSAFYRAFRRWTGTTPLDYRRRHAA